MYKPDTVFLQIGGNDINPTEVFNKIKSFACDLLRVYGVSKVIVGSVFRRFHPRRMCYEDFEKKRKSVNDLLCDHFKDSKDIVFWKLRGLVDPEKSAFRKDGVHLNDSSEINYVKQIKLTLFCKSFE